VIRHIVLINPIENLDTSLAAAARDGLAELAAEIPGICSFAFGANNSPEEISQGYELGFTVDFVDAAARDAYLPHPAHQRYIPAVQAIAAEVLVFDFEI
jgi:hypothetical protein